MVHGEQPVRIGQLYVMESFSDKSCLYNSRADAVRYLKDLRLIGSQNKRIYEEICGPVPGVNDYYVLRDGWGNGTHYYSIERGPLNYRDAESVRDAAWRLDPRNIWNINHSYRVVADVTDLLTGKQKTRDVATTTTVATPSTQRRRGGDIHYHNDTHIHIHLAENTMESMRNLQDVFAGNIEPPTKRVKDTRLVEATEC